ncbi:MAG: DUF1080 domain-containing protein [Bacteroidaceae bacterium]|nr:DUF1080 domain-containing protein [Bacteroidaceae bacterium]
MRKSIISIGIAVVFALSACLRPKTQTLTSWHNNDSIISNQEITVSAGEQLYADGDYTHFILTGEAYTPIDAEAALLFHSDGQKGYEVLFRNGPIDGTRKSGSLSAVRNLYRSLANDTTWFQFQVAVRGKNIAISINGTDVVCYTEPEQPYRTEAYAQRLLSHGQFFLKGHSGTVKFRNLTVEPLSSKVTNPNDTLPPIDEQIDSIIRLQQRNFPVIDYHVHLKGGLTKEQAHAMSMNYGINYGVAPNAGEGGVGRMLANDEEVYDYYEEVKPLPFLCGVQGEGRRWSTQFSQEALGIFDYLFTDAMTIVDKGKICRIYHPEELHLDERTRQQYMDVIISQIELILSNEPADIYANATYIPEDWMDEYDELWTPERVDRLLNVLQKYGIALEISPRYRIPSLSIIRQAKERGLKFTFGTNNADANFGRLEYVTEAITACGITSGDIWFPSMSTRRSRPTYDYNGFGAKK